MTYLFDSLIDWVIYLLDYQNVKYSCGILLPFESTPSLNRQNSTMNSSPRHHPTLSRQKSNGWNEIKSQVMPFKNEQIYTLIKISQTSEDKVKKLLSISSYFSHFSTSFLSFFFFL